MKAVLKLLSTIIILSELGRYVVQTCVVVQNSSSEGFTPKTQFSRVNYYSMYTSFNL